MKRSLRALALCLALLFAVGSTPSQAADVVYFTAVNDSIRELTTATMPFWANGVLYVEGAIFENRDLNTGYFYNSGKRLAVVYERGTANHALYFDLTAGTVTDANNTAYSPAAILRHGTIFLPVRLVTSTFGLSYTNTKVAYGYLTRVRSDKAVLSDQTLADAGVPRMESQYQIYEAALEAARQEAGATTPAAPGETVAKGQVVQLCFRAGDAAQTAPLLDVLDSAKACGTFYFTAGEICACGDLVRRMVATGHGVGLVADSAAEDNIAEQLRQANEALWQVSGSKTRLCLTQDEEAARQAAEAGYVPLKATLDRSGYALQNVSAGNALFRLVSGRKGRVKVWLGGNAGTVGLRTFLRQTTEADDRLLRLTETD